MKGISVRIKRLLESKKIAGMGIGEKIVLSEGKSPLIFLCGDFSESSKIKKGLEALGHKAQIIAVARENIEGDDKNLLPFVEGLNAYISGQIDTLILLPCSALVKFDLSVFLKPLSLKVGESKNIEEIIDFLAKSGYERVSLVSDGGQFALRGDILDIFVTGSEKPVRIEFFDEQIEAIHYFEPSQMKNLESLDEFVLPPSHLPVGKNDIFDLKGTKIIDEPKRIEDEFELLMSSYKVMSSFNSSNYVEFESLLSKADYLFDNNGLKSDYQNQSIATRNYLTDFMALKYDIENYIKMGQGVLLFAGSDKGKEKIFEFLRDNGVLFHDFDNEVFIEGKVYVSSLDFPYSFSFLKERIVAIGSESLFRGQNNVFTKGKHSVFYLPKLGDYVVHSFHGIGKCIKIERMKIADYEKDYFVIEYKNGGVLYLPSEEANSLSAYIGSEEEPKLSALGGGEFTRLKNRVKDSLKEMAFSLLEMYKEREKALGYKFKRDEYLEKQFDDAFGFQLTPDQAKAINDINHDMESHKVMDRLICGDVGFGKTEVALRACFKCAYNGKQVCLLCPTTILSQQHYINAKERLEPFGVKVEVLNRFKTQAQTKDILRKLANGEIDVLIGTHRLLSGQVVFKDLGLLVLDEEQRFGVEHKEKIKNAKRNLDVLSLSATPIPRTLNMSLSGIRDISIIETPPKDRLPIQTYVVENSDSLIKDVLSREISRGGQAFIIYNRVESIDEFALYVKKLLPNVRIGVAHGQMHERVLEDVINKLYDGEFDIFISTTLIENGIDLPSANTMIIIDADKLGLGQLYQIRGRIGRSDKLSYAYLTYDKTKILSVDAYKRLSAIKEFSSLGSGFKIAMRDLEIRGAGNIFGKEQHGHIAKVGYDMFVKLLDEAVEELKGQKKQEAKEIKMEVAIDAYIGENYISSSDERIALYTKISELSSISARDELIKNLSDGYGEVPNEVKNLCSIALLKNLASGFGVNRIRINSYDTIIFLDKTEEVISPSLAKHLNEFKGKLAFESLPKVVFDVNGSIKDKLDYLIDYFVKAMAN